MTVHELKPMDVDGPVNIPASLRELADEIEAGTFNPRTIIIIQNLEDRGVDAHCIGYRPKVSETLGLLEYAKLMFFERSA